MSIVPTQLLQKLRCLKCNKYLSQFPVHQSVQPHGSICGRCSVEEDLHRNTLYEEIAALHKFPCCYDLYGCLDTLYPDQVNIHEKFCKFRQHNCPLRSSENCKWTGFVRDLWDHFEKRHLIFIIRENGFEIDLLRNYSQNYLLSFENQLYIVNESNFKSNVFSCNVRHIGSNSNSQGYFYKLILENVSSEKKTFVITKQLEEEMIFDKRFILETLGNPSMIIAHIEIYKPKDENEQYEKVQWELLNELECCCCFEYMLPPVHQCITGHSICSTCKVGQGTCPTCRQEFKDTINITLGNLIDHLIYPCRNEGCKFTCKSKDIKKHQSNCTYGKFKCPLHEYEQCFEEVSYENMYKHILNNHYENLLEMDTVSRPFRAVYTSDECDHEDCFILRYDFRLFKLHYKCDHGKFSWEMQLIGTTAENIGYQFEIDVTDKNRRKRVCFRTDCTSLTDKAEAFRESTSFVVIDLDQIKDMVGDELTYDVRILPKEKK